MLAGQRRDGRVRTGQDLLLDRFVHARVAQDRHHVVFGQAGRQAVDVGLLLFPRDQRFAKQAEEFAASHPVEEFRFPHGQQAAFFRDLPIAQEGEGLGAGEGGLILPDQVNLDVLGHLAHAKEFQAKFRRKQFLLFQAVKRLAAVGKRNRAVAEKTKDVGRGNRAGQSLDGQILHVGRDPGNGQEAGELLHQQLVHEAMQDFGLAILRDNRIVEELHDLSTWNSPRAAFHRGVLIRRIGDLPSGVQVPVQVRFVAAGRLAGQSDEPLDLRVARTIGNRQLQQQAAVCRGRRQLLQAAIALGNACQELDRAVFQISFQFLRQSAGHDRRRLRIDRGTGQDLHFGAAEQMADLAYAAFRAGLDHPVGSLPTADEQCLLPDHLRVGP